MLYLSTLKYIISKKLQVMPDVVISVFSSGCYVGLLWSIRLNIIYVEGWGREENSAVVNG